MPPAIWAAQGREPGFAMPLVIPVVLLLILGAVTLANRSTNSYIASAKQADAQAARQAAESGMNRVVGALNPYAKNATDSYMAFLLASKWDPSTKTWSVLSSGNVGADLKACNLSIRGVTSTHALATTAEVDAIRSGVISPSGAATELRYTVVDYSPPGQACAGKSSLSVGGGTARISVQGTVVRNQTVMARYTLTRNLDVQLVPMPNLLDAWKGTFPGPPVGLRISTTGTGLGDVTSAIYADFENDANIQDVASNQSRLLPVCGSTCDFSNGMVQLPAPDNDGDLPYATLATRYPFSTTTLPAGKDITTDMTLPDTNYCSENTTGTYPNDIPPNDVNCYVASIKPGLAITVNTEKKPVNLIIKGDVGAPEGSAPPTPPTAINDKPPAPYSLSNFVTIRHQVGTKNGKPIYYDHGDKDLRPYWERLRIFGVQPSYSTSSACSVSQSFYIRADQANGASLEGAFVWLPHGELIYGTREAPLWKASQNAATLEWSWVPTNYEAAPAQLLSAWWVCKLTFNAIGASRFILPIYGNLDGLRSILPDTGPPLFPLMPRIRSVF